MNWVLTISFISIHNLAFMCFTLFRKRNITRINLLLSFILMVFAEIIAFNICIYENLVKSYPILFFINYILIFTIAPHFLSIINIIIGKENETFSIRSLVHFIPSFFSLLFFSGLCLQPVGLRNTCLTYTCVLHKPFVMIVFDSIFFLQIMVYLFICYRKVFYFRRKNPDAEDSKLLWFLIKGVIFLCVFIHLFVFISLFSVKVILVCCSVLTILFYDIYSYGSFKNYSLWTHKLLKRLVNHAVNSCLSEETKQKIDVIITRVMEEDKYFQNSTINLNNLAERCSTPRYLLTVYLNQYHDSFYDFVNRYRIEEAKKILISSEGQKYSVEVIAQKCGFNSRSVFYSAFKKYTGLTPIQYIKIAKQVDEIKPPLLPDGLL